MFEYILDNWLWFLGSPSLVGILVFVFVLFRRKKRFSCQVGSSGIVVEVEVGHEYLVGGDIVSGDMFVVRQEKPEWYELLTEEFKRLPIGTIVFNPPETMKVGNADRIEARISRDSNADLITSLKGRGVPRTEELKISELMKVRLSGDHFQIASLNEDDQIVDPSNFTEWAWNVTPKKRGKQVLHLHVTLRIRLPFGEEKKDHPVLDREIVVSVNPVYSMKSFVATYWKWIVTALLLPLLGWFLKEYFE